MLAVQKATAHRMSSIVCVHLKRAIKAANRSDRLLAIATGGQHTPSDASGLDSIDSSEFTSSEWEGSRWDSALSGNI